MRNEFEKQVQDKMEELDLVPSAPVWHKIEEQIRAKKDRRRAILWIFLFGLLVAGGATWFIQKPNNIVAVSNTEQNSNPEIKTEKESKNTNTASGDQSESKKPGASGNHQTVLTTKQGTVSSDNKKTAVATPDISSKKETDIPPIGKSNSLTAKPGNNKTITSTSKSRKNKSTVVAVGAGIPAAKTQSSINQPQPSETKKTPEKKIVDTVVETKTPEAVVANTIHIEEKKMEEIKSIDSLSVTPSAGILVAKPKAKSKWQFGIVGVAGVSTTGNALRFGELIGEQKAMLDATPMMSMAARIPYASTYTPPTSKSKGFAFSIGGIVRKVLGKKTEFSTGLQYDYYSTRVESSSKGGQMAVWNPNSSGPQLFNPSVYTADYTNSYHFVSIPLSIDYRLFKKTPVYLNGGISIQQLIGASSNKTNNAATADSNGSRTKFFSGFGLNYRIPIKGKELVLGPEFVYGLSKVNTNHGLEHLYSIGLKAKYFFKKAN